MPTNRAFVLIVDDDAMLRRALAARLAWAGFQVETVPNGRQAIDRCAMNRPDAVILDVGLPDTSGYRVCERIRSELKDHVTPIVFLTGLLESDMEPDQRDAFLDRVGGQFLIRKPYDARHVIDLLNSITRNACPAPQDAHGLLSLN